MELRKGSEEAGDLTPQITEYIGECFILIAERLSTRPNFINYSFRDEMVGDAIENCLIAAKNFGQSMKKKKLKRTIYVRLFKKKGQKW